ncbi:MAG: transglycosylase SLT domain-containing protein [Desulfovibrionaceae bacterium]
MSQLLTPIGALRAQFGAYLCAALVPWAAIAVSAYARGLVLCRKYTALPALLGALCAVVLMLGLLAGFVPQREGPEIRRRVSTAVAVLHAADMPAPAAHSFTADNGYAVRRAVSPIQALSAPLIVPEEDPQAEGQGRQQLVVFLDEGVSLSTVDGPKTLESVEVNYNFIPLLPMDGTPESPALSTMLPAEYGESLDSHGRPLRWKEQGYASLRRVDPECQVLPLGRAAPLEQALLAALPALRSQAALSPNLRPFDSQDTFSRARRYKVLVEQAARRFGLSLDLVYAIIHNESNFAPVLVSNRSAMGLMQLLPSTAGGEVHTFLYGHPGRVSFADLSNPETNIRYGTAYLHLLLNRHLAEIRDTKSREFCAVAAYNMGPNRFLRIFSADRDRAFEMINTLTPEQVYTRLTQHLPMVETRYFVAKVTRSRAEFAAFE